MDCYFDTLVTHGFGMEAHAQNTLIAIDSDYQIKLIVFRDMESVDKDLPLREYLGVNSKINSLDYTLIPVYAYHTLSSENIASLFFHNDMYFL